jgi:hypothetical protein
LSEIEKGKMCYDLMKKYPDKYPTQETLAQSLGFPRRTIAHWISLYETAMATAAKVRDKVAKFEPKKNNTKFPVGYLIQPI